MSQFKWFGYCPETGFEVFDTEEKAKNYAKDAIDYFASYASEGWSDEVNHVCWGKLSQETVMANKRPCETGEFEYMCDYELKDVE